MAKKASGLKTKAKAKNKVKTKKPKVVKPAKTAKQSSNELLIGVKLPTMSLLVTNDEESGTTIKTDVWNGKKIVLYFYPKDATPGCTIEGHDFTKLHKQFQKLNTEVYGVSRDSMKSHCKFKDKQGYSVELISDEEETLCNWFQVIKDKNMYGRIVRGIERSTFIIDENGKVLKEWRGVKVPGHANEVLEFIKSL